MGINRRADLRNRHYFSFEARLSPHHPTFTHSLFFHKPFVTKGCSNILAAHVRIQFLAREASGLVTMEDSYSYNDQKVLMHSTGSFTGLRPLQELGSGYLSANTEYRQPLCGNKEGWGPLSPYRYDFTPCFIDVWVAIVAVGGLVLGLGSIYFLRKRQPFTAPKNIQFWLKQVSKHLGTHSQYLIEQPAHENTHKFRSSSPSSSSMW